MRPSYDTLKALWVYSYARAAMIESGQWLDAMDRVKCSCPEFRALVCAAVIAYARPFTKCQVTPSERVIPLKGVPPPAELNATHDTILKLRDRVMGHKDATPAKGDAMTPNIIFIRRDAGGFDLHTIIIDSMTDEFRREMRALSSFYESHCDVIVRPLIESVGPEVMKHSIGEYELVPSEPPQEWIRKAK